MTWTVPTFNTARTEVAGSKGSIKFCRAGNTVFIYSDGAFRSSSSSISNGAVLSQTIPSGYRPVSAAAYAFLITATMSENGRLGFGRSGKISYRGTSEWNSDAWFSAVWITADDFPTADLQ